MKTQMLAAATVLALGLGAVSASAQDSSMGQGHDMLTGAVYNALNGQGFDTSNIENLTLGQIAQIRSLLADDMGSSERQRVEKILESADG